jgi:hypothetical protein
MHKISIMNLFLDMYPLQSVLGKGRFEIRPYGHGTPTGIPI